VSPVHFIEILAANATFALVALACGETVLRGIEALMRRAARGDAPTRAVGVLRFGAALLVGFGAVAYVGVGLGLVGAFYWWSLAAAAVLLVAACRRGLAVHLRWLRDAPGALRRAGAEDPALGIGAAVAAAVFLVYYAIALAPPFAPDALAYHLPEAEILVHSHRLGMNLGGHWHYGNLPKLIEVLWAEAGAFLEYPLAQTLHMSIVGAFLLVAFGLLRELYGARVAILAVAIIAAYPDLVQVADTPMIDGAVVAFELAGFLCVIAWAQGRRLQDLGWAAVLLGLALATKYSPAPTVLYACAVVGVLLWRRSGWRGGAPIAATLAAITFVAAGFWYVKNLVRLGNPAYPLFFGHRGVSDAAYQDALGNIQRFGPRTLSAFLRIPIRFENVLYLPEFLAFFTAPFALLVRHSRLASALLFAYCAVYTPYWFFLATHQIRFLMPALVAGLVLLSVVAVAIAEAVPRRVFAFGLGFGVVLVAAASLRVGLSDVRKSAGLPHGFPQYQVGAISGDEYLGRNLGCSYSMLSYLRQNRLPGNVIDNWSTWHDVSVTFYATDNRLEDFAGPPRRAGALDLRYIYFKPAIKQAFFADRNPFVASYKRQRAGVEADLLRRSKLVWSDGACRLYRIA